MNQICLDSAPNHISEKFQMSRNAFGGPSPVLKGGGGGRKRVRDTNKIERSRGRSLVHGQDMGKTQDHRSTVERWLTVGGWRRLAVGSWWTSGAVLNKNRNRRVLKDSPAPAPGA